MDRADGSITGQAVVKVKRAHQGHPWSEGMNSGVPAQQEKDGPAPDLAPAAYRDCDLKLFRIAVPVG